MYFGLKGTDHNSANLVNFVNDRIDINGTVNAIQNNKIGGNLFFLSADGMAVGKSGVINTGSLYVMTPTENYMKNAMDVVGNPNSTGTQDVVANVIDTAKWHEIPVNASGTITVLGQVNATNEVKMRAAKIGVGKNVDDKVVDGVASGKTDATNAIIQTGVTNFGDLVNIKGVDGAEDVKSGLTGELIATKTGSGDIILEAYVDNKSNPNAVEDIPQIGGVLNGVVNWGENNFKTQNFDASVDVYGEVNAAGEADITATAVNSNVDVDDLGNYVDNKNTDVAQLANVNAKVNIGNGGAVTAEKAVTVKAEAINRYVDNTGAFETALKLGVSSTTPLTGDAAYSKLDTDASVNIEQGATVTSTGGDVNIDAKAETLAASAASTLGLKFKTVGGYKGANVPAAAVVYTEAHNDAKVTVNGDVTAAENINIDADADLTVEAENKMTVTGEKANQFVVGVTIANASNNADVTIGVEENKDNSGNVTTATTGNSVIAKAGNLTANATADSDFTSKTSISAGESSAVGVAVNVTNFNSGANVNVNTKLKAGKDLTVNAADTVAADNVMAESKVGSGKYMSSAMQVMGKNGSIDAVKGFASDLAKKMLLPEMSDDIKGVSVADVLHAGATVTYSGQNHNSGVTIGNDASLTAGGKLDIDAQTKIEDAHFTATGATNSYNDATAAPVTLNAAVLVTNMNNSSSVVVEDAVTDEDGTEHKAELEGIGGVEINASTRFEYNRVQKMKDAVTDAAAQIEHAFTTLDEAFEDDFGKIPDEFKDLKDKYTAAYEAFTGKMNGIEDGTQVTSGADNFIDAIVAGYQVLTALEDLNAMLDESSGSEVMKNANEAFKGASDLFSGALAFVDPNSYGTFAAASTSKGSSGDVGGSAPGGGSVTGAVGGSVASAVNGAGAVMVNTVNSVSKVEIGSDAEITSKRKVNIGAENYMKDVSLGGLNLGLFNNAGGGTSASIGATVNYAQFDTDTIVAVNDGAKITGGYINVNANNEIDHVSVAASAGKGPSAQTESDGVVINGMLSFVNGSSDILTVVDDGASLTAKQNGYTETVKDEETDEEKEVTGNISINGHNNTNITNVAAGASWGKGSAAVGVGLAYTDFEVKNITGVADVAEQIKRLYGISGDSVVNNADLAKINNTYTEEKADTEEDTISAYDFSVDAATDGSIQSVSAAGTLSNDDASGQIGFFDKINSGLNSLDQKLVGTGGLVDKASGALIGDGKNKTNANELINLGTQTHGGSGGIKIVDSGTSGGNVNTFMPSFSLAGSGSVSINMLDNATEAIVDNAKITMQDKGDISVTARDTLYAGAYSGAAAVQWNAGGSSGDKSVSVSGAAGVNDIANAVKAAIKNSTIKDAGELNTMALSGGEQLALGLGMAVVKADGTTGYSGNAAVSVNLIDHDVEALLENNIVTDTDDVNVTAYARDIENAGGGGLTLGQQKVGVGATVGVAMLNNNISAGIKGGSYEDVGNVDVEALNALQNITVGIAAGVTAPSGNGGNANVQGAGVYNEVHNTTNAFITGNSENDKVVISTVDGGSVNVTAQDVAVVKIYEDILTEGLADGKQEIAKRMGENFKITGENELAGVDMGDAENELNKNKADNEKETVDIYKLDEEGKTTGSSIITVAGSIAGSTGKAAVGGAAAITDIENNYTANIDYADITTENLTAEAGSDSNIVTVAGGVAAANKGSGVGSVSWNDVDNTAKVDIKNSVVKAQNTAATAKNTAQIVSVGGQVSASGKAGVGATLSYVGLDSSTEANITDTTFDKRDTSETNGITVKAEAQNTSDSYNVGFGIAAGSTAAVSGTVVVTQTHGTAGAVMDKVTISNANEVTANALDDTDILSVIGNVTGSGKAAVGAGVAYTEIGDVSTNPDNGQYVTAEIKNSTINTIDTDENEENAAVNVTAKDTARVINVAVGVGGAANAAVQGASATTLINKTTGATMNNTNVYSDENGSKKANVTVDAQNDSEITSSADTVSAAMQGAGVGAGIAVNRIIQQTNAAVNGGTMNVNNLTVKADATPRIENIGIGVAVAGEGAGVTGSVAVNMIENDVTAHIGSGANIVADGSVGVVATSDEQIANYAGQAAVAGVGAGVGVSVSVNQIAGTTSATVGGEDEDKTTVTAKGNDSLTTNTKIDVDNEINNELIDGDTVGMDAVIDRTDEERSGLIVDASSTRDSKSFLITAGVAGEGAGVAGTVNVNQINGGTDAGITNTTVNGGENGAAVSNNAGVFVNAGDYSNMSGFVGSVGVGGVGAGAGLASDTNTISREVNATIDSSDIKANTFELEADSAQGVSSFGVGVGAAGIGGGAAGIVTVTELKNTTKTMLNNSKVNANTVSIKANHTGIVNAGNVSIGGAGLGVGGGLSVGVLKDNSTTEVTVVGDDAQEDTITASGDVTIAAANTATVNPMISANGVGAFGGIAGATSINNLNSKVVTDIEGVGITSTGGNISGTADNTFNVKAYMGTIGAGAVGAGVGVTVNTIDSTVQTNVNGSALDAAKDVTLTAKENRNIEQLATNAAAGGGAVGANIAVTNVGQKIDENSDAGKKITEANDIFGGDAGALTKDSASALATAGIENYTPKVDADFGGGKNSQITVNINGSKLEAGDTVKAEAVENDEISMTLGGAAVGTNVAVAAGVGILNVNRNVGVNIKGGGITADTVNIGTDITGKAELNVYQGSASVYAGNAAIAMVNTTGKNDITINGTTIAGNDISIMAADQAETNLQAVGVAAGIVAAGALVAEAENDSDVSVSMTGTVVTAEEKESKDENGNTVTDADGNIVYEDGNIEITTNKANKVTAQANNTAGGAVGGTGMGATVTDTGSSTVALAANEMFADNLIDVNAQTNSTLTANIVNTGVGLFAAGAVSIAEVNAGTADKYIKTAVTIGEGNTFAADDITFDATSNISESMDMDALAISGYGTVGGNSTKSKAYADVTVTAEANNTYRGSQYDIEDADEDEAKVAYNKGNVSFNADNTVTQTADTSSVSAAGLFATGTNIGETISDLKTNVTIKGSNADSNIADLTAEADSTVNVTNKVNGDGGAIADISPYAAMTDNDINSTTEVTVGGNWNIAGDMKVSALHTNNVTLTTDAVKAAIVGGSGVHSDNDITNNTNVTFDNATVTTGGSQNISARNDITYNADIQGSGYGGVNVAAVAAKDDITSNTGVTLENDSALEAKGSVNISAVTGDAAYDGIHDPEAAVNKNVTIKSAGLVSGTYAESTDNIKFTNNINVGAGSSIKTTGTNTANADINLTAADRTNFTDVATADTQGGVVGAAWTEMNNTITRNNNITVGGTVDSNYDANFDAGDTSKMNLTLRSNAYNKTAAPLATNPSLESSMTQNSSIDFDAGSSVRSLRNINAAAGAGDTTIAKESKTWRWVDGGETGTGSIASTSDGTLSGGDAVIDTTVTVDGTLEAGKNYDLDITIDYVENGKENMEAAFDKYYKEDLELSDLGQKLEDAQDAYNIDENVRKLKDAAEKLNKYKEQQENNEIIKGMLQDQIDDLNGEKTVAEGVKGTAEGNLEAYIESSLKEYNDSVGWFDRVDKDEFEKALKEGDITKPWYDDYSQDYNDKVDYINQVKADITEIQKQINAKVNEQSSYADYSGIIKSLEDQISDWKATIKPLEDALKAAQENYDKALESGIAEKDVNNAIFNGHIGDEKDTYVTIKVVPDWYKEQYGSAAEQIGMIDYAASLLKRMNELIKMSQEYSGTDVGKAYTAELSRIQRDLQALGLLTVDSQGNIGIAQGASSVPTIELKDLLVSGGNVNISSGTMEGNGSITAHGDPSVTITNNTDFFLRVNDVKIAGDGGSIKYNDAALTEEAFKGKINAEQGTGEAKISIHNTSGTSKADELTQYDETLYTPDIGIYGEIYNPYGNIEITNAHNNIYVAGEVKDEDGNVTQKAGSIVGQTINLTAGGSVTQGYSDEIYNAAGDPKNALSPKYITAIQNALIAALGTKKDEEGKYYVAFDIGEGDTEEDRVANLAKFLTGLEVNGKNLSEDEALQAAKQLTGQTDNSKPNMAAGGAIYINAASINVNGTIQSGFEDYKLAIDQDKAAKLIKDGNTTGKENLTYEDFMTDTWRVTADGQSGAYYDEVSKTFVYGIQAWYNPITNEIFTEDIEQAGGGRIYLTGAIANTNASGGKLVVLDGGSDYTIDGSVATEKKYTFKLGSINAETVAGRIEINDTSGDETVTTVYTNADVDDNGKAIYNPTEGLYYNWSNGTSSRVTTSYKHVSDSSWWGLSSSSWESVVGQLDEVTKDQMIDTTFGNDGVEETTGEQLDMGNIITDGSVDGYTQLGTANSGTTAVNGSTAKNDNTLYQIMFERQGERKQGRNDAGDLLYLDANGELTTVAEGNTPYYLKDEDGNYIYKTVISDKVTTTKKKGLLGLWGKTVTTEWKETSGMITAYNFGLKADNSIGIEFVGQAEGSTGTIKSNSDILLGGDIHMGQVEITSGGSINHVDNATVISDNATFNARTGIDVIVKNEANPSKLNGADTLGLDGEELGNPLHLKATTTSGNINIQAVAANEYKDVYIDNVSTGAGNVTITAEGSLLNGNIGTNGYAVKGDGITLQSYGGNIGSSEENGRLLIDGDVSYVANSDKKHGAISTNAAGGVYLTEVDGNMYLGEIVAENGDVVLEVKGENAGFVDAIENNSNGNKDSSRVDEWTKLGLLGTDTVEKTQNNQSNQLTNLENAAKNGSIFMDEEGTVSFELAQEQGAKLVETGKNFVEQMEGANATVQKARENLNTAQGKLNEAIADLNNKKEGSEAAYKTALEAYNNAYDAYEQASADYEQQKADFIKNSGFANNEQAKNWLTNYEAIGNAEADNYGWTQQQLLYAVQDTVINPNAGSVSDVKTANVTGNNITFISNTGNLGVVDTQETVIETDKLAELFTKGTLSDAEKAQLDKLASARAGDVTWGDKKITIERTTPVSVKLNSDGGTVKVQNTSGDMADHIYLLAKDSVLNADKFAANDLRLSGQEGLNVNEVTGNSIYLEGGSGDIGHKVNDALQAVQVTLKDNGFISANAAGNVALQQVLEDTGKIVDFTLGSVAGKNVDIDAVGSIVSRKDDIGYINASETIDLTSTTGGIGTSDEGLRIKNSGAVVNTDVQDAIYIEAKQDGTLILGKMEQADGGVNVDSEGSIYIGRENDESLDAYIDAKDDVNLHAAEDIIISGKLHVNATEDDSASNNGTLNLHADAGDIIQTTDGKEDNIVAANVGIAAIGGNVELANENNIIKNVDIQAVGGSLGLAVSNPEGFNVDMGGFTNKLGGDVSFTNSDGSVNITTQDITDPKKQDEANINGSLTVTAKKVTADKADINNKGILNATDTIKFTAVSGVIDSNTVNAKDVIMQAIKQELENIIAKDSVTLNGDRIHGQNITQNKDAAGDLIINTGSNGGDGPIESLVIDKIDANDKSVFTDLWAEEAKVTTVDDKMDFNKILIEEMAWLKNSGTLATVYGNIPVKDENANVHIYQAYPYMYFNFVSANTVESDGRLLSLDNYWYVYDQRFTAEDHMRWQHGRYLDEDWKQAYGYGLSLHDRYGLIDYQHFTEENAGEDEIAVEA